MIFNPRHVKWSTFGSKLVSVLAAVMVATPLISLVIIASTGQNADWPHLASYVLPQALQETAFLLVGVALLSGLVGLITAWLTSFYQFWGRQVLVWLLPLPLAMPLYLMAYIYVELFDRGGVFGLASTVLPPRSLRGCIVVMSLVLYPYIYLSVRAMFLTQSASLMDAARAIGTTPLNRLRLVILPLARPALAVGLTLALLEALNDIGASEYLGVRTLTLSVYVTWLNRANMAGAAQIACLLLIIVACLVWLEQRSRKHRRYDASSKQSRIFKPDLLTGWKALAALCLGLVPVIFGFVIPVCYLVNQMITRSLWQTLDTHFFKHTLTTLSFAAEASLLTIILAFIIVTASRFYKSRFLSFSKFISSIGYAVPGTVLGLGLLVPLVKLDEGFGFLWNELTHRSLGLVLLGSGGGVVIAYTIRFLSIAIGGLSSGFAHVSPRVEDAARSLGAGSGEIRRRIQWPLLRPAMTGAALLVFVDCMKELPVTLLLRPLGTETLSTLVYGAASRGVFEEGALAALIIILVSVAPVILLTRHNP